MSRTLLSLLLVAAAAPALPAQQPAGDPSPSDLQVQQDPQMYLLMKMMERSEDPQQAVRRKAEQKAAERRGRLASQKWFGYSPLRPSASPVPWMGVHSQRWVGNGVSRYDWVQQGYLPTAVRVESLRR